MSHVKLFELKSCVLPSILGRVCRGDDWNRQNNVKRLSLWIFTQITSNIKQVNEPVCNKNLLVSAGEASHTVRQFEMIENYDETYLSTYLFLDEDEIIMGGN